MKKSKVLFALSLASLTALTGCKGSKITGEKAVNRAKEIQNAANYDVKAFTVTTKGKDYKSVTKYSEEKKVAYSYTKEVKDGNTSVSESYIGVKDGVFYTFDVQAKTYSEVSGLETIVNAAWEVAAKAFLTASITAYSAQANAVLAAVISNESLADDEKSANLVAYSSGSKAMAVESTTEDSDGNKTTTTTYIKNNLLSKVVVKSSDSTSKTTYKYSASVKLPSTSGYTKK